MDQETKNILKESFDRLPKPVQEAILGTAVSETVQAIGKKHSLFLDQVGGLETEVMLLLVGLTETEEFVDNLSENLEIGAGQGEEIAKDVNDDILEPIKRKLIEGSDEEDERELSRDSLLQEIENPSPARFSRVPAAPPSLAETHNTKVLGSEQDKPTEPRKEELAALPLVIDPSHELAAPSSLTPAIPEPVAAPIPPSIPSVPVSPPIQAAAPGTSSPITQAPRTVTEIKPIQPEKRRTMDPYREPIE